MRRILFCVAMLFSVHIFAYNPPCDQYGFKSIKLPDGTCGCIKGYIMGELFMFGDYCVLADTACSEKFGYGSIYDSSVDMCVCSSSQGYFSGVDNSGASRCVTCKQKYGENSEITTTSGTSICGCKEGYSIQEGKCELSANSTYYTLKEYDSSHDRALVEAEYDGQKYLVELEYVLGVTSEMSSAVGEKIVVNMGTDFSVDIGDYIILPAKKLAFKISDAREVSSDFSLFDEDGVVTISNSLPIPPKELIGYWQDDAKKVAEKGIIEHRDKPSEYNVTSPVLRQEIIAMALKIYGTRLPDNYNCRKIYQDISSLKPNNWVCRTAEIAADQGIITKENRNFNPEVNVTIAESLAILFKANGIPYKNFDTKGYIFPVGTPDWQKPVLAFAQYHKILTVVTIGNIPAFRGQIFDFIIKIQELQKTLPMTIDDLLDL